MKGTKKKKAAPALKPGTPGRPTPAKKTTKPIPAKARSRSCPRLLTSFLIKVLVCYLLLAYLYFCPRDPSQNPLVCSNLAELHWALEPHISPRLHQLKLLIRQPLQDRLQRKLEPLYRQVVRPGLDGVLFPLSRKTARLARTLIRQSGVLELSDQVYHTHITPAFDQAKTKYKAALEPSLHATLDRASYSIGIVRKSRFIKVSQTCLARVSLLINSKVVYPLRAKVLPTLFRVLSQRVYPMLMETYYKVYKAVVKEDVLLVRQSSVKIKRWYRVQLVKWLGNVREVYVTPQINKILHKLMDEYRQSRPTSANNRSANHHRQFRHGQEDIDFKLEPEDESPPANRPEKGRPPTESPEVQKPAEGKAGAKDAGCATSSWARGPEEVKGDVLEAPSRLRGEKEFGSLCKNPNRSADEKSMELGENKQAGTYAGSDQDRLDEFHENAAENGDIEDEDGPDFGEPLEESVAGEDVEEDGSFESQNGIPSCQQSEVPHLADEPIIGNVEDLVQEIRNQERKTQAQSQATQEDSRLAGERTLAERTRLDKIKDEGFKKLKELELQQTLQFIHKLNLKRNNDNLMSRSELLKRTETRIESRVDGEIKSLESKLVEWFKKNALLEEKPIESKLKEIQLVTKKAKEKIRIKLIDAEIEKVQRFLDAELGREDLILSECWDVVGDYARDVQTTLGNGFTWMDGVTYEDWEHYHSFRTISRNFKEKLEAIMLSGAAPVTEVNQLPPINEPDFYHGLQDLTEKLKQRNAGFEERLAQIEIQQIGGLLEQQRQRGEFHGEKKNRGQVEKGRQGQVQGEEAERMHSLLSDDDQSRQKRASKEQNARAQKTESTELNANGASAVIDGQRQREPTQQVKKSPPQDDDSSPNGRAKTITITTTTTPQSAAQPKQETTSAKQPAEQKEGHRIQKNEL